jgi:hypothetical protein
MRLLLISMVALLLAACGPQHDSSPTTSPVEASASPTAASTPTATPTPECDEKCELLKTITPLPTSTIGPPAAAYPAGTRTGEPVVDSIIDAIEGRDQSALTKLIGLTTLPCVAMGNRQPEPLLCRDGVAPGTPKTGIWITHVEGGLAEMTDGAAAGRILAAANEGDWKVVSVYSYERAGTTAEWMPETDFFITFTTWHPQGGPEFDNLRVAEGRVTALHFAFPEPYPAWDNPADPGWLLPRAR